jgi:hypothetical protein
MNKTRALLLILVAVSLSGCLSGPTAENGTGDTPMQENGVDSTNLRVYNTDDVQHTLSVSVETPNETFVHPLRVPAGTTETVENITAPKTDSVEHKVTVRALGGPERNYRWNTSGEQNLTVRYDGDEIQFGQGSGAVGEA